MKEHTNHEHGQHARHSHHDIDHQEHTPERDRLLPLMFEMGRLLKAEISNDGESLPSYLHMETLRFIQSRSGTGMAPTMSDIAEYLRIAPPSATALVNAFVKEGVLDRVDDPEDRRRVRLSLSEKGTGLLDAAMRARAHAFARLFRPLSDADCDELARILTIVTQNTNS